MENKLSPIASVAPVKAPAPTPVPASPAPSPPSQAEVDAVDLRLVIEQNPGNGTYVYKTVDRRTGKVVQQLPREEVVTLRRASNYKAGAIIKTQV